MRRLTIIVLLTTLLVSCGGPKELYNWGGTEKGTTAYENVSYISTDKQTPESLCALVEVYEKMVSKPGGKRKTPPPGICAEYGYLLLQPETAAIFSEHANKSQKKLFDTNDYSTFFIQYGQKLMLKEIEYYPESSKFLEPLLKKLSQL